MRTEVGSAQKNKKEVLFMTEFRTRWLQEKISNPKVILDVGCCKGKDTVLFKEKYPSARVIGIEADPYNYEKCQRVIMVNQQVEFYHYAVRNYTGETSFYQSLSCAKKKRKKRWTASGSVFKGNRVLEGFLTFGEAIIIPCITLETFCKEKSISQIDFLHMDVQGAEVEVIQSFGSLRPSMIFAEISEFSNYDTGTTLSFFEEFMRKLGYKEIRKLRYDSLWFLD